jgi:hypothetical protein
MQAQFAKAAKSPVAPRFDMEGRWRRSIRRTGCTSGRTRLGSHPCILALGSGALLFDVPFRLSQAVENGQRQPTRLRDVESIAASIVNDAWVPRLLESRGLRSSVFSIEQRRKSAFRHEPSNQVAAFGLRARDRSRRRLRRPFSRDPARAGWGPRGRRVGCGRSDRAQPARRAASRARMVAARRRRRAERNGRVGAQPARCWPLDQALTARRSLQIGRRSCPLGGSAAAIDQKGQGRDPMDAAVMPLIRRQHPPRSQSHRQLTATLLSCKKPSEQTVSTSPSCPSEESRLNNGRDL